MTVRIPMVAFRALRQARSVPGGGGTIAVGGARELVPLLAGELRAGGDPEAVTENRATGRPAALVWIGKPDEDALRSANGNGVPIIGVTEGESLPYVLDTNIVPVPPGRPLPVQPVAQALARVLGQDGASLAARLPVLRGPVMKELVRRTARRNGLIGAAAFLPGPDLPALTLNEALLTMRMAVAAGRKPEPAAVWPELLGVAAAGLAARRVSRSLEVLPVWGFLVKGAVACGTSVAIGEALRRRFG